MAVALAAHVAHGKSSCDLKVYQVYWHVRAGDTPYKVTVSNEEMEEDTEGDVKWLKTLTGLLPGIEAILIEPFTLSFEWNPRKNQPPCSMITRGMVDHTVDSCPNCKVWMHQVQRGIFWWNNLTPIYKSEIDRKLAIRYSARLDKQILDTAREKLDTTPTADFDARQLFFTLPSAPSPRCIADLIDLCPGLRIECHCKTLYLTR